MAPPFVIESVVSFLVAALAIVTADTPPQRILQGARRQVAEAATYAPGYFRLDYPGGDLPRDKGVCTDVVIRALRTAGFDLQVLMHRDMKSNFKLYPQRYGLRRPDTNIDHRRVPNQTTFFRRFGAALTLSTGSRDAKAWKAGDIVYWKLDAGLDHCGIVSDAKNAQGLPLVIHNLGRCIEEDCLTSWKIVGHFRYPKS